jgi:chitosanase
MLKRNIIILTTVITCSLVFSGFARGHHNARNLASKNKYNSVARTSGSSSSSTAQNAAASAQTPSPSPTVSPASATAPSTAPVQAVAVAAAPVTVAAAATPAAKTTATPTPVPAKAPAAVAATTAPAAAATAAVSVNKGVCLQMTTTCENSTTKLAFNYAQNIGDGRGITFGCIGFTTGTYDGNMLIKYYTQLNPNNTLAKYIPALNAIDAGSHNGDMSSNVTGLTNFIQDVNNCTDPLFKQAQLYELDQLYWNPAASMFNSIGAKYTLTMAFIYDMSVRHGADGAKSIISQATSALGGTPKTGVSETAFLSKLMDIRDSELKAEGLGDTDRVVPFRTLLNAGNLNLAAPFQFTIYGDTFTIDGNIN